MTIQQGTQKFAQTFAYDAVNRLTGASEAGGWSQSYGYDPYGNMWLPSNAGLPAYGPMPSANLYSGANQNPNMSYDGAGNQTVLGALQLTYNAENRQVGATNTLGGGAAVHQYDGAGQRVAKTVAGQTTVYVYDAFGVLKAEYDSQSVVAPPCATCYLSYDHLGSVRMVTDQNGVVVARHDLAPYGQEIPAGVGARSSLWGSTSDVEQKFTGQLRDNETGEDYFNARYLANVLGRFMSADPANAGADLANPQSWNGYAYVLGNPLANVDPSGEQSNYSGVQNGSCPASQQTCPTVNPPVTSGPTFPGELEAAYQRYAAMVSQSFWGYQSNATINYGGSSQSVSFASIYQSLLSSWSLSLGGQSIGDPPVLAPPDRNGAPAAITKKGGTYVGYSACLIGAMPQVLATSAFGVGLTATAGRSYTNPVPPPPGILRKAPHRIFEPGLKWGLKGQVVGALVFLTTYEVELNSAARSCSTSTGYTPWALEP